MSRNGSTGVNMADEEFHRWIKKTLGSELRPELPLFARVVGSDGEVIGWIKLKPELVFSEGEPSVQLLFDGKTYHLNLKLEGDDE